MPRSSYSDLPSDESVDRFIDETEGGLDNEFAANHNAGGVGFAVLGSPNAYTSIRTDEEEFQHVIRRRRPPAPETRATHHRTGSSYTCFWMTFLVMMTLTVAAIVSLRIGSKMQPPDSQNQGYNESSTWKFWGLTKSKSHGSSNPPATPATNSDASKDNTTIENKAIPSGNHGSIHYDHDAALHYYNPFNFKQGDWYGSVAVPPSQGNSGQSNSRLGYLSQPCVVGKHLVFVTEGDLYYTRFTTSERTVAFKLTTTVGNVRTPMLNPQFPYFVAFTATYTGHREVYVMDMRPSKGYSQAAIRLTFWDNSRGIHSIVGWKDNGRTLIFSAQSREVGLPDTRLYQINLQAGDDDAHPLQVLQISPIPLSQAIDGVWNKDCVFFTRFQQSSNTVRYVGGTAESLWAWCEGQSKAVPLTSDYQGTSKRPSIVTSPDGNSSFLLFLSDRNTKGVERNGTILPSTMNLFSIPLPTREDLYNQQPGQYFTIKKPQALTEVSCAFGGLGLKEYSTDNDQAILRIGADLHLLTTVSSTSHEVQPLDIVVYSDFHEHQERLIPVGVTTDMTSADVYTTSFGSTVALLGMRGQLFVAPVLPDINQPSYAGAGMNLPPRRYRVAPGTTVGGLVRVLYASFVPMPQENGQTTRRLTLVLATDPKTETAEHAFYLIETQSDSAPSFVGIDELPVPFLGGSTKTGGSVANGGLGSVDADSVTVSPCGRRMAWTDTDGRICVLTMPMYLKQSNSSQPYTILPSFNENGEPMVGVGVDLTWSPGGRYLAINHSAKNQFLIISIADCGDPNEEGNDEVADIKIGRIVQATPARFNSLSPYWGRTGMDRANILQEEIFASLLGKKASSDSGGATTLYFLTDRDVVSDVESPWGTRAPSPHFVDRKTVYALPLFTNEANPLNPMHGIYAGGGAAELWADGVIDLQLKIKALEEATPGSGTSTQPTSGRRLDDYLLAAAAQNRAYRGRPQNSVATVVNSNGMRRGSLSTGGRQAQALQPSPMPSLHTSPSANFEKVQSIMNSNVPTIGASGYPEMPILMNAANPTIIPTLAATAYSTGVPTRATTVPPSGLPTIAPTIPPTAKPSSSSPSTIPSTSPSTLSPSTSPSGSPSQAKISSTFPNDNEIEFGSSVGLDFARTAYRLAGIPVAPYKSIVCQLKDDPSLILVESTAKGAAVKLMATEDFPSDKIEVTTLFDDSVFLGSGVSTDRDNLMFILSNDRMKIVPNTASSVLKVLSDVQLEEHIVDTEGMAVSIWPSLEYRQMFNDAWRMLRDYFYDTNMHGVDWPMIHKRYSSLVPRCSKREELDDVMEQMAAELSALHVFVYGGEYKDPMHGDKELAKLHHVASLGANFERSIEYNGFIVTSIAHRDPDYNLIDGAAIYSPLSSQVLTLSGQRGLEVGDVIVGVNGESVMRVPDLHVLLRGTAGRSVRLDVVRQPKTKESQFNQTDFKPEPVITVPITQGDADNLRYAAWEWNTRQLAKSLALEKNFSVGYVHLRSMEGPEDIDAFTRGFFSDFDKQAMIIDVRHNNGGNIDSWLLNLLQRRAWMYWQGRVTNVNNGGLGWDQQFAFRGHFVVLIDEKSSSDAEGFARGVSELGLGKLVGTRTWGGGIWLSSDNHLVDGGIATAPEVGTYNNHFGWGLGIEQRGVSPDVYVDNNPRLAFDGKDEQLEKAIEVLAQWLLDEPVVQPRDPGPKHDMSLHPDVELCF